MNRKVVIGVVAVAGIVAVALWKFAP